MDYAESWDCEMLFWLGVAPGADFGWADFALLWVITFENEDPD